MLFLVHLRVLLPKHFFTNEIDNSYLVKFLKFMEVFLLCFHSMVANTQN